MSVGIVMFTAFVGNTPFGPYIHSDDCFKVASFRVISEKLGFYQPVSKLLLKKFNFIILVLVRLSFDCLVSKDYHSEL